MKIDSRSSTVGRWLSLFGLIALCLIAGSATRGKKTVPKQSTALLWWQGPLIIGGGLVAVPVGWVLRRFSARIGCVLIVAGPVLLIVVAPAMFSNYVVMDDEHFEATYGFWFSPTKQDIKFADLQSITYVEVKDSRGRSSYEMHILQKTGSAFKLPAGDLVRQTVPELFDRAKARGVTVIDLMR